MAVVAKGITVTFAGLSGELVDVNAAEGGVDTVDVTHQASDDDAREFLAGLFDAGTITLSMHYGSGQLPARGTTGTLAVTMPTGADSLSATAILTKATMSAALGQKATLDVEFKITGATGLPDSASTT